MKKAFEKYLETREIQEGLTTNEFGVVIPEDTQKEIIDLTDSMVSLKDYVTVKPVKNLRGTKLVRRTLKDRLITMEELGESPRIISNPFLSVSYETVTKRAFIQYSMELKEDRHDGLVDDLKKTIAEVVKNTENSDIIEVLNEIDGSVVSSLDDIKDIVNTSFPAGSDIKLFMTQKVFNALDKLKDDNGSYLLKDAIENDLVVVDDEDMEDNNTIFIGDLKDIIYFDRADILVSWMNYLEFGESLGVTIRNDVKKVEDKSRKINIEKVMFIPGE